MFKKPTADYCLATDPIEDNFNRKNNKNGNEQFDKRSNCQQIYKN